MKIDLTKQDVQNIQLSVLQMAKSSSTDAPAMKLLMILHDKLDKSLKEHDSADQDTPDFTAAAFQNAAASAHKQAVEEKESCCGGSGKE